MKMRVVVAMACAAWAACAALHSDAQDAPPHHSSDGFHNNYPTPPKASFWRWKWEQLRYGVPEAPPEGWNLPQMDTDGSALRANRTQATATWIGHSSFLLQLGGINILTDPHFSARASPVPFAGPRRVVRLPIDIPALPAIDVVVISHNHYDHLDLSTVKRLAAQPSGSPLFLVPLGLRAWFIDQGIPRVEELDWWASRSHGGVRFTLVPVQHWSKRTLWDTNETLWGGWAMEGGGLKLLHTGDLGYSPDARDIGERLGPFDMAFIPIGAYAPRWFMKTMHVDVAEAIRVKGDVKARRAIGMHWGTFEHLTDEPLDEPPRELARQRAAMGLGREEFDVLRIGETRGILPTGGGSKP
jgi:N-acyl-phosphatidylethanolamine-hydrolysing phospholipase D